MRAARTDANQGALVAKLRAVGATVQSLASVGCGCPDLLVGWHGKNLLMEVKDESKPPSGRKFTPEQAIWHKNWTGQVAVVKNFDEAMAVLNKSTR